MDKILEHANNINKINENKYFIGLTNDVPLTNFLDSQRSFGKAVDNWSKILGLMLNKVPSENERIVIVENLYDEHGSGNINNCHVNTFKQFIQSLDNINIKLNSNLNLDLNLNYIIDFNNELLCLIQNNNWIYGVCLLGMIEYTYITISKNIHNYISKFINPTKIIHYSLHEIMDIKHSTDLFSMVLPYLQKDPELMNDIKNGIQDGYQIFDKLYNNLYLSF
jgi:pyrroloquinoline-quinone synthase